MPPRRNQFRNICPVASVCTETQRLDAPECGSIPEHTPPMYFAEQSCLRALSGAHEALMLRWEHASPQDIVHAQAWSNLELGMAIRDDKAAEAHFATAATLAEQLVWADSSHISTRVDAAILGIYVPIFKARRTHMPAQPDALQHVREGLASIHDFMQALSVDWRANTGRRDPVLHARTIIPVFLAAVRWNTLLYPASPREVTRFNYALPTTEQTVHLKSQRHDAYTIIGSGTKLPLKINSQYVSGKRTHTPNTLYYRELIRNALNSLRQSNSVRAHLRRLETQGLYDATTLANQVPLWLSAEAQGKDLTDTQRLVLDLFTGALHNELEVIKTRNAYR